MGAWNAPVSQNMDTQSYQSSQKAITMSAPGTEKIASLSIF